MYSNIINPETGNSVSIKSSIGKQLLKKYLVVLKGGAQTAESDDKASDVELRVRVGEGDLTAFMDDGRRRAAIRKAQQLRLEDDGRRRAAIRKAQQLRLEAEDLIELPTPVAAERIGPSVRISKQKKLVSELSFENKNSIRELLLTLQRLKTNKAPDPDKVLVPGEIHPPHMTIEATHILSHNINVRNNIMGFITTYLNMRTNYKLFALEIVDTSYPPVIIRVPHTSAAARRARRPHPDVPDGSILCIETTNRGVSVRVKNPDIIENRSGAVTWVDIVKPLINRSHPMSLRGPYRLLNSRCVYIQYILGRLCLVLGFGNKLKIYILIHKQTEKVWDLLQEFTIKRPGKVKITGIDMGFEMQMRQPKKIICTIERCDRRDQPLGLEVLSYKFEPVPTNPAVARRRPQAPLLVTNVTTTPLPIWEDTNTLPKIPSGVAYKIGHDRMITYDTSEITIWSDSLGYDGVTGLERMMRTKLCILPVPDSGKLKSLKTIGNSIIVGFVEIPVTSAGFHYAIHKCVVWEETEDRKIWDVTKLELKLKDIRRYPIRSCTSSRLPRVDGGAWDPNSVFGSKNSSGHWEEKRYYPHSRLDDTLVTTGGIANTVYLDMVGNEDSGNPINNIINISIIEEKYIATAHNNGQIFIWEKNLNSWGIRDFCDCLDGIRHNYYGHFRSGPFMRPIPATRDPCAGRLSTLESGGKLADTVDVLNIISSNGRLVCLFNPRLYSDGHSFTNVHMFGGPVTYGKPWKLTNTITPMTDATLVIDEDADIDTIFDLVILRDKRIITIHEYGKVKCWTERSDIDPADGIIWDEEDIYTGYGRNADYKFNDFSKGGSLWKRGGRNYYPTLPPQSVSVLSDGDIMSKIEWIKILEEVAFSHPKYRPTDQTINFAIPEMPHAIKAVYDSGIGTQTYNEVAAKELIVKMFTKENDGTAGGDPIPSQCDLEALLSTFSEQTNLGADSKTTMLELLSKSRKKLDDTNHCSVKLVSYLEALVMEQIRTLDVPSGARILLTYVDDSMQIFTDIGHGTWNKIYIPTWNKIYIPTADNRRDSSRKERWKSTPPNARTETIGQKLLPSQELGNGLIVQRPVNNKGNLKIWRQFEPLEWKLERAREQRHNIWKGLLNYIVLNDGAMREWDYDILFAYDGYSIREKHQQEADAGNILVRKGPTGPFVELNALRSARVAEAKSHPGGRGIPFLDRYLFDDVQWLAGSGSGRPEYNSPAMNLEQMNKLKESALDSPVFVTFVNAVTEKIGPTDIDWRNFWFGFGWVPPKSLSPDGAYEQASKTVSAEAATKTMTLEVLQEPPFMHQQPIKFREFTPKMPGLFCPQGIITEINIDGTYNVRMEPGPMEEYTDIRNVKAQDIISINIWKQYHELKYIPDQSNPNTWENPIGTDLFNLSEPDFLIGMELLLDEQTVVPHISETDTPSTLLAELVAVHRQCTTHSTSDSSVVYDDTGAAAADSGEVMCGKDGLFGFGGVFCSELVLFKYSDRDELVTESDKWTSLIIKSSTYPDNASRHARAGIFCANQLHDGRIVTGNKNGTISLLECNIVPVKITLEDGTFSYKRITKITETTFGSSLFKPDQLTIPFNITRQGLEKAIHKIIVLQPDTVSGATRIITCSCTQITIWEKQVKKPTEFHIEAAAFRPQELLIGSGGAPMHEPSSKRYINYPKFRIIPGHYNGDTGTLVGDSHVSLSYALADEKWTPTQVIKQGLNTSVAFKYIFTKVCEHNGSIVIAKGDNFSFFKQ